VIEENGKKEIYFNDVEALKAVRSHLRDTSGDYLDVDNVTLRKEFNHLGILLGTSTEGEGKRQKIRYTARRDWPNGQKNMRILVLNPAIVKEKLKVDLLREDEPFKEESPEGV
jgi:hypothetical protein